MKRIFISLMAIFAFVGVCAQNQVEFGWSATDDWTQDGDNITRTVGSYTISVAKADGSSKPTINGTALDLRSYASNVFTITADGKVFTKIVFTVSDLGKKRLGDLTPSSGEITFSPDKAPVETVTWEGNPTSELTITVGAKATYGSDGASKAAQFDVYSPIVITESVLPVNNVVTLSAGNYSRTYGEPNPTLECNVEGIMLSGNPTITCDATALSPVGEYPIVVGKGSLTNDSIVCINGTLTITPAPLTITANSYTRMTGDENPNFEATYSGFKNGEDVSVLTQMPSFFCAANTSSPAGLYDIIPDNALATNYDISYENGALTVVEPIIVSAANATMVYGDAIPELTYDTSSNELGGNPLLSTTATSLSPVGTYPIVATPGSVSNPYVRYVNGTLTVTPAPLTITAKSYLRSIGEGNPEFEVIYSGFKNGENDSVFAQAPTITCSATLSSGVGTYDIIPSGAIAQNYDISYVNGTLTIANLVKFADNTVKTICVTNWDTNGDGGLSVEEAAAVTSIGTVFKQNTGITSFDELRYFTSITSIPSSAFYGCTGLKSIELPESITSIGGSAFYNCTGLKGVVIPNNVTSVGASAFYGCTSLEEMIIPNNVTTIGSSAFYGCSGLQAVVVGNGVTALPDYVFGTGANLKSLTIGSKVQSISQYAFRKSSSATAYKPIKTIWMVNTPPTNYTYAGGTVNYVPNSQYNSLSGVSIYSFLSSIFEVDGVKYVPVSPSERTCDVIDCRYDETMAYVNIGETVTYRNIAMTVKEIKPYAFYKNLYINDIQIANQGSVGAYAFAYSKITDILSVANQGAIGESAFSGITGSFAANINNVGRISAYAFSESTGLQSLELGSSVTNIGEQAFYGCYGLRAANVQNNGTWGNNIFQNCTALQSMEVGNAVTSIGTYAFDGCNMLQAIVIPDSVTSLGAYAFRNCSLLASAEIGERVTALNTYTFSGCSQLTEVHIGNSIQTIGTYAFNNCYSLPQVVIPKKVTSINNYAFSGCSSLRTVIMEDSESEQTIGTYAFNNCYSLPQVVIPKKVISINNYAFSGCSSLRTVIMEDSESELSLGRNGSSPLFASCPLDSIYIGRNITYSTSSSYGYSPFYRNTSLRSVYFTNKETEISDYEFYGCTNLKNVRVGDGITSIGKWAFSGCAGLEYFAFGRNVQSIGQEAFSDCTSVTNIISLAATPPTCESQALDDINKWSCTLNVPQGTIPDYQAADQWRDFFFMDEIQVVLGDFDKDGQITNDDVTILVDIVLGNADGYDTSNADVNMDGRISVADVTALVNMVRTH